MIQKTSILSAWIVPSFRNRFLYLKIQFFPVHHYQFSILKLLWDCIFLKCNLYFSFWV